MPSIQYRGVGQDDAVSRDEVVSPYRVVFVCLGNICRSPIAEVVLRKLVDDAGLGDQVDVSSAGTAEWHVGKRADQRTLDVLARHGYDGDRHRARQFEKDWFDRHDLVLALDRSNLADLQALAAPDHTGKVRLLMSFDSSAGVTDVPDPYYGGPEGFDHALSLIEGACRGVLDHVAGQLSR
jgi:protein-tyrosine phosphatase